MSGNWLVVKAPLLHLASNPLLFLVSHLIRPCLISLRPISHVLSNPCFSHCHIFQPLLISLQSVSSLLSLFLLSSLCSPCLISPLLFCPCLISPLFSYPCLSLSLHFSHHLSSHLISLSLSFPFSLLIPSVISISHCLFCSPFFPCIISSLVSFFLAIVYLA